MRKSPSFLLLGLCAAGLLAGYAARRVAAAPPSSITVPDAARRNAGDPAGGFPAPASASGTRLEIPHPRSTDTLETLLALDDGTLYGRPAAWLMDADERDIAAYWDGYRGKKRNNDIARLVFIQWTRLSPRNAIAAVAGSKDEHFAWRAWASHDPQGSLAAAIAAGPERVKNVASGIGESHPEWLRAHLDQIPEAARRDALSGLSKWSDDENPLKTLRFLKANGIGFDQGALKALVRKDPWAAFDWIKENPGLQSRYGSDNGPMGILLATMSTEQPDDLMRLAAQTPPGELKRKMEAALFDNLLATDPAAALAQAKATDAPLIAAERLAQIGLGLVKSDPEQAFEIANSIFAASPGKLRFMTEIEYPNGGSSSGGSYSGADELMSALLTKDPARIVEMAVSQGTGTPATSQTFNTLTNQWATQDLAGYTNWVNGQIDPVIRDPAAGIVVNQLTRLGQFSEAAEWAMSRENPGNGPLYGLLRQWKQSNPKEASDWLEAANLPAMNKAELRDHIKRNP